MKKDDFLNTRYSMKSNLNINDFTITTITPKIVGQEMKENIEYFKINIIDNYHKKTWAIERDSSDFIILYNKLSISYYDLPPMPSKNLLNLFDAESVNSKKELYQQFLSSCVNRKDLFSNIDFKNFIELKNNSPELFGNKPKLVGSLEFLPESITDMKYIEFDMEKINILILSTAEMGVNNIKTNEEFLNFFNSNEEIINNNNILGMTMIFEIINNEGKYEFNQLWQRKFKTQNTCLYFDKLTKSLFIGREDGFVSVYKMFIKSNHIKLELNIELKNHFSRIVDIWYDPNKGKMYTISTDRRFVSCDINSNNKKIQEINRSVHNYTKFCIDLLKNRIFIGTDGGIIEIYSTTQSPYQKVGKLRVSGFGNISDLFYEKNNSRLFVCDKNGKISIFEIGDVGKEKISLEISQFGFKNAFNSIKYDNSKKEIITGDILGKITIWNIKRGEPIYSLNAHEKMAINSTFYLEDKRLIITGGRDKSVKFWKFPEFWFDEKIKKYENEDLVKINSELKKKRIQMEKIIEGNNEVNYESDISENEEELNGWNYDSDDVEDYDNINAPK